MLKNRVKPHAVGSRGERKRKRGPRGSPPRQKSLNNKELAGNHKIMPLKKLRAVRPKEGSWGDKVPPSAPNRPVINAN
jgi:hypothetical protein